MAGWRAAHGPPLRGATRRLPVVRTSGRTLPAPRGLNPALPARTGLRLRLRAVALVRRRAEPYRSSRQFRSHARLLWGYGNPCAGKDRMAMAVVSIERQQVGSPGNRGWCCELNYIRRGFIVCASG
jgi:hypothetical protein